MECMRKEGGESKNGTSMMSVIIEAGALSMLSNFNHPRSIDIGSTSPDPNQSLLDHVLLHPKKVAILFRTFLQKVDEFYDQPASETIYSDFVKRLINLRKNDSQDRRKFDTFMYSLTFIEEIWRSWLIRSKDIESDFKNDEDIEVDLQNDEDIEVDLQNDEDIEGDFKNDEDIESKREIAEATYEYIQEFSNLHTDFLEDYDKGIYNSYLNDNKKTKRVLDYWINKRNRNLGRNQGVI